MQVREQIKQEKPVTDIDFIQVSCHPLVSDLNREVEAWMSIIGKTMHDGAKQQAMALNDAIADRIAKLGRSAQRPWIIDACNRIRNKWQHRRRVGTCMPMSMRGCGRAATPHIPTTKARLPCVARWRTRL